MSQKLLTEEQKLMDYGPPSKRMESKESDRPKSPRDINEIESLIIPSPKSDKKMNFEEDKKIDEFNMSGASEPQIKYVAREKKALNQEKSGMESSKAKETSLKNFKKQKSDSDGNLGRAGQSSLSALSKEGTVVITAKNKSQIVAKDQIAKASFRRKTWRLIAFLSAFVVTILLLILSYYLFSRKGSFIINSQLPFEINIDSCNLVIHDRTSQEGQIHIKYRIPGIFSKADWSTNTTESLLFSNHVPNEQCFIDMYIDPAYQFTSLTLNCLSQCNVTQNSTLLNIQNQLEIKGISVAANIRDISASNFVYNTTTGYLQLNHITLTSTTDNIITINGDLIIQSSKSFAISATTDTQAFCFSAPNLNMVSMGGCAVSGDNSSSELANSTTCTLEYNICEEAGCPGSLPKFVVESKEGNVYANLIPKAGSPISSSYNVSKGAIFDGGIQLDELTILQLEEFNSKAADVAKEDPRITFSIGSSASKSSAASRWAITANPAYSYMKPWWIGAFTSSILNSRPVEFEGHLLPGFCPFYNKKTINQLYEVQNLIKSKLTSLDAIISLIQHPLLEMPPLGYTESTGVASIPSHRPFYLTDKWYSLIQQENFEISFDDNNLAKKPALTGAIVLSFIIAFIFSMILRSIVVSGLNSTYKEAWRSTRQLENYSQIEQKKIGIQERADPSAVKKKRINNNSAARAGRDSESESVLSLLVNPPHLMEYIDFLFVLMFYRTYNNSVNSFYSLLLRPIDEEVNDEETIKNQRDTAQGNEIKILYEKFCFLNGYCERRLTDQVNLDLLNSYGYQIRNSEKMIDVFVKINIKNYDNFFVHIPENGVANSLSLYLEVNVDRTSFTEDQIKTEDFIKAYTRFCEFNRLTVIENLTPEYMLENYNIETQSVSEQIMTRIQEEENILIKTGDAEVEEAPKKQYRQITAYSTRMSIDGKQTTKCNLNCCRRKKKKKQIYVIDSSRMEDHFKLLTNSFQDMNQTRLERAKIDIILNPLWQFEDFFSVVGHIFFILIFTVPMIILMVLTESQYTPWSQEDPRNLLLLKDLERDPFSIFGKILNNGFVINYGLLIIIFIFFCTVFIDTIVYYSQMEFPLNKFFDKHNKVMSKTATFFYTITYPFRVIPWLSFMILIFCIFGYVFLLAIWLLLGAIIKPEIYLPYASAAVTFIIFVKTKFSGFKSVIINGEASLKEYLEANYGETLNAVLHKFSGSFIEMSKDVLKSSYIKSLASDVTKSGLMNAADLERFQQKIEESASNYMVNTIKDPKQFVNNVEEVVNTLRLDTTTRVKDSCSKRGIPPSYVDLLGAISRKETACIIKYLREILKECTDDMTEIDLTIELLFPESSGTDEYGLFIAKKAVQLLMQKRLKRPDPQSDILTSFICNYKNIQDKNFNKFLDQLRVDLSSIDKKEVIGLLDQWKPALCIAIELCETRKSWKVAEQVLDLVNNTLGGEIVKFLRYYQVLSATEDNVYDLCSNNYQNINDIYNIITEFWTYLDEKKIFGDKGAAKKGLYSNIILLLIASCRQEIHKIPWRSTRDLSIELFLGELGTNDYLPFCWRLASTIHQNSLSNISRFEKPFLKYFTPRQGVDMDEFKEFIRLITFYYVESSSFSSNILKNKYLVKLSNTINFMPEELLGLMDYLYRHHSSKYISSLLKSLLSRRGIPLSKLPTLQALIDIYLAPEEKVLTKAAKTLELRNTCLLLVGREMLNPKYVPSELLKKFNVRDAHLKTRFNVYDNKDAFNSWKLAVKKEIETSSNKEARLAAFYLGEERNNYTKQQLADHIDKMNNPPSNRLKEDIGAKELDFLWNFMKNIGDLRLSKDKEKLKELTREHVVTIENIAKILKISSNNVQSIISLFLEYDSTKLSRQIESLFPEDNFKREELKRIIDSANKFSYSARVNKQYLTRTLPTLIKYDQEGKYNTPSSFLESNLTSFKRPRVNDLMDVVDLIITKGSGLNAEEIEKTSGFIYMMTLFARETLNIDDLKHLFKLEDEAFFEMSKVNNGSDQDHQITGTTALIPEGSPLKLLLVLYGLIVRGNFKVTKKYLNRTKSEEIGFRQYLSEYLNIFPEFFILFELVQEKDLKNFLTISKSFMLRMNSNTRNKIDIEQIQSLITLIQGDQHNYGILSQKLGVSAEHIFFILALMKIGKGDANEIKNLGALTGHKNRLNQLGIKHHELRALVSLVGSKFKKADEINDIVTKLSLKKSLDIEILKGLQNLSTGEFENLKTQCSTFLGMLGLEQDYALFFSSLANGNYKILVTEAQFLDWMFPNDPSSKALKLATFLCGIINPRTSVKKHEDFINIAHQNFQLNSFWVCAFLFEISTYKSFEGKPILPQVVLAIVLNFLGLQDQMRDIFTLIEWNFKLKQGSSENTEQDEQEVEAFKLNEETKRILKRVEGPLFKGSRPPGPKTDSQTNSTTFEAAKNRFRSVMKDEQTNNQDNPGDPFYSAYRREMMENWMAKNFRLDYEELYKIVNSLGLGDTRVIRDYFGSQEAVYRTINQTMLNCLRTIGLQSRADTFKAEMQDQMHIPSEEFLDKIVQKILDPKVKTRAKGIILTEFILYCFDEVINISGSEKSYPGNTFTDLSIISGLARLRFDTAMRTEYFRLLYNAHQVVMNIERKYLLEEFYLDINKFNNIKLMGASMGIPLSNVIEFSLPSGLITEDYLWKMKKNSDDIYKIEALNVFRSSLVSEGEDMVRIGDLGDLGGTLKDYKENYKGFLDGDWEFFKVILDLKKIYFGSPYSNGFFTYGGEINDPLFNSCALKKNTQELTSLFGQSHLWADPSKMFISKSIMGMLYKKSGEINYPRVNRMKFNNEKFNPHPEHTSSEPVKNVGNSVSSIKISDMFMSQTRNRASSNLQKIPETIEEEDMNKSEEIIIDNNVIKKSNSILLDKYQGKRKKKGGKKGKKRNSERISAPNALDDLLTMNDVVPEIHEENEEENEETIHDRIMAEEEAGLLVQFKISEGHNSELETNIDGFLDALDKTYDNLANGNNSPEEHQELLNEIEDIKSKFAKAVDERNEYIKNCDVVFHKLQALRKKKYADKPHYLELESVRDRVIAKGCTAVKFLRIEMNKMENSDWPHESPEEKKYWVTRCLWYRKMLRGARRFFADLILTPTNELSGIEKDYEITQVSEILPPRLAKLKESEALLENSAKVLNTPEEKRDFLDKVKDYNTILTNMYITSIRNVRRSRLNAYTGRPSGAPRESIGIDSSRTQIYDEEGPYVIHLDTVKNNMYCLRTAQTFNSLKRKSLEFELHLMNPNLFMIQRMIMGDEKVLYRQDNKIGKMGRQVAELYLAIVNLQKVDIKKHDFRDSLRHSITNLQLDSDTNNLTELISYFLTQKVHDLYEIGTFFDIKQNVMDILFVGNNLHKENNIVTKDSIDYCVMKLSDILQLDEYENDILAQMLYMYNRGEFDWRLLIRGFLKRTTSPAQKDAIGYLVDSFIFNQENVAIIKSTDIEKKRGIISEIIRKVVLPVFPLDEEKINMLTIQFQLLTDILQHHSAIIYETMKTESGREVAKRLWISGGVLPENADKINKIFQLQNIFRPDTLSHIVGKPKYEEEIAQQAEVINNIFTEFGLKISDAATQLKLCKLLIGILSWDSTVMLKSMIGPNTIEDVYVLFCIQKCFKFQRINSSGKDFSFTLPMQAIFVKTINKFASQTIASTLSGQIGSVRKLLEQELDCVGADYNEIAKALEAKIDEFHSFLKSYQDKPYEYMCLVDNFFAKKENTTMKLSPDNWEIDILESTYEGSFITKCMNSLNSDNPESKNVTLANFIENSVSFVIKMYRSRRGHKVDPEEASDLLHKIVNIVTTEERERNILKEVININIPLLLGTDVSFKINEIMELILHLIVEFNIHEEEDEHGVKEDFQFMIISLLNLFPCMSLTAGTKDFNLFRNEKDKNTDFKKAERLETYYGGILLKFFPQLIETTDFEDYKRIYRLTSLLRTDLIESLHNPDRKREILRDIEKEMKALKILTLPLEKLLLFIDGDVNQLEIIATLHKSIPNENVESSIDYLKTIHQSYNLKFWSRLQYVTNTLKNNTAAPTTDDEKWADTAKKVKEGTATNKELFYFADQLGNKDGTINQEEFKLLACRLDIQLTDHRIQEIFAKIKGRTLTPDGTETLDEKEFERAMDYLQQKNVVQGLQLLGISSERLYSMLVGLIILLLLIFLFIFFGIRSFALGGTFGSIINSFFPAVGALGLGKNSPKPEQSLDEDNIQEIGDKTTEITGSTQL